VFHYQLISIGDTGPFSMMGIVFARMPEWLFGAWLAEWFTNERHLKFRKFHLASFSVLFLFAGILTTLIRTFWGISDIIFGLGFSLLIAACITPSRRRKTGYPNLGKMFSLLYRILVWTGTISFSIYLFHDQLSWLPKPFVRLSPGNELNFILRIFILVISIPVISIIFLYVEAPFLNPPRQEDRLYKLYNRIERVLGLNK
jgi:peptidoglycan/LPS O-acetylase OafA/YrhL